MTKSPSKSEPTADPVDTALHALTEAGLGPIAWMGTAWVEAISDIGSDALRFLADRVSEDVQVQHDLLHCKSMQELQQVQARFMERAYAQYTLETGKIIEKSAELFRPPHEKRHATPV